MDGSHSELPRKRDYKTDDFVLKKKSMGNAKFNLHQKYLRFRRGVTFHTYKNVRIFYDFSEHLCTYFKRRYLSIVGRF